MSEHKLMDFPNAVRVTLDDGTTETVDLDKYYNMSERWFSRVVAADVVYSSSIELMESK